MPLRPGQTGAKLSSPAPADASACPRLRRSLGQSAACAAVARPSWACFRHRWSEEQLLAMELKGNAAVNADLEAEVH